MSLLGFQPAYRVYADNHSNNKRLTSQPAIFIIQKHYELYLITKIVEFRVHVSLISECKGTTFRGNSQYQEIVILYQYCVVYDENVSFFY